MITFDQAVEMILKNVAPLSYQEIPLSQASSEILFEDIYAEDDLPHFSSSAMDGYALIAEETGSAPVTLKIIGVVKAGDKPNIKIEKGQAVKIMTGAPLPKGTDAIVMVEKTEEKNGQVIIKEEVKQGENVRLKGEEIKKGQLALPKGSRLNPSSISFLATLGKTKVKVYRKPKVAVLITGNEVVPPEKKVKLGEVRDANSYGLAAALKEINIVPLMLGIARDNPEELRRMIDKGLREVDVFLITGGVSVGEYDLVKNILSEMKVEQIFWKVAIKPGKPIFFGRKNKKLIFGLPGNPVSVLISFLEFVRPALFKMMGYHNLFLEEKEAVLIDELKKKPGRVNFLRGIIQEKDSSLYVKSSGLQYSHTLSSFAVADCIIILAADSVYFKPGTKVKIQILPWR
ncbi:MAG: gephyrin-like molybdotransferase Glp [Candidatus Aminicenantia bacterium]